MKEPTEDDLVEAVKKHALANYNSGGWDYIVECWSDHEIKMAIEGCVTIDDAVKAVQEVAGLLDERRNEIMSEAF
jgi:hypothetical protein